MGWRTSLFQRFANVYPTASIARSRVARGIWRTALEIVRPERVVMDLADYRVEIETNPRFYGRSLLHRGGIESAATAGFRAQVKPAITVVDVGANVGHYTLTAAARLAGTGRVVAFEPDPGAGERLRRNVALNEFSNVTIHPAAVGDTDGPAELYRDAGNSGGHSLYECNVSRNGDHCTTNVVRLDTVFGDDTVDLIKIDAQGADDLVLIGAEQLLRRSRPAILLEFWPWGVDRAGSSPSGLLARLEALGYAPAAVYLGRRTFEHDLGRRLTDLAGEANNPHAAGDILFVAREP